MLEKSKVTFLSVVLVLVLYVSAQARAVTIAEGGRAKAVIVVDPDDSEAVQHAALELAGLLRQVTGASFQILHQADNNTARLLVGKKAVKKARLGLSTDGLGSEGIMIRAVGSDLALTGESPRGTLYAVYTFLEDYVGCRWWTPTASKIVKRPTLKIENLDVRYVPPLEYRWISWKHAYDSDNWVVRNKLNGKRSLGTRHGGRIRYEGFVHTFFRYISPKKYLKDHPEWFSLIDGRRYYQLHKTTLCLTNEEMRAEFVKNLKERLRKRPGAHIASVSQPDGRGGNCQCDKCRAVEAEEGSPAGLVLRFVNKVAADIEKEFPNVYIDTLAYSYTRKPPKYVRPRANVIVRLCSIECSFSKPFSDDHNKDFRDNLVDWSKICDKLYIWDYTTNFRHYILPHPNLRVLAPNIRFLIAHKVKGIFEQGAGNTYGAEMAELRAWVLAKLLWNPYLDDQKLVEEFAHGYYGPAAGDILAYLNFMHDAVEKSGDWLGCYSPYEPVDNSDDPFSYLGHTAKFLSFENLSKGWSHLKAAEDAVKDSRELSSRVKVAQLPVMYAFIMRWDEFRKHAGTIGANWPMPDTIEQAIDDFARITRRKRVTRLNEWKKHYNAVQKTLQQAL